MGVRQQAPGYPAAKGPPVMSLSHARLWALVNLGGLPGAFFDRRPAAPCHTNALTHRRIASADTWRREAICAYREPSATASRAITRLAVRKSPRCSASPSMRASAFRVWGARLIRIPSMASPPFAGVFAMPYRLSGLLSSAHLQPQKLFRKVYS